MSGEKTSPVALRMTDAGKQRLLAHGGTPRQAVEKLMDLADEHKTCPAPRLRPSATTRAERAASTAQQDAVSTTAQPRQYEVQVAGRTVFRTTSAQLAERRRKREQDRHPMRKVEVR